MLILMPVDSGILEITMSSQDSTDGSPPEWFVNWRVKEEKRNKDRETWKLGFGIFGIGLSVLAIGLAFDNSSDSESIRTVALFLVGVFATGFGVSLMMLSQWNSSRRGRCQ